TGGHGDDVAEPGDLRRRRPVVAGQGVAGLTIVIATPSPHRSITLDRQRVAPASGNVRGPANPVSRELRGSIYRCGITKLTIQILAPSAHSGVGFQHQIVVYRCN